MRVTGVRSLLLVFIVGFVEFIGVVGLGEGEWLEAVNSE